MRVLALALFVAALAAAVHANIISVDVGSDSMKIALVKPGLPFHIVTNLQSKRKTPVAITFHDGERFFGADALGLLTRKPEHTFIAVHRLLGRNDTHEISADFFGEDQYIAHGAVKNARGGIDVTFPDLAKDDEEVDSKTFKLPSRYSVEEITAMILAHGRDFSEAVAEAKIKDCVITVPSFYTQNERLALIDAAELAGLNVVSLVDETFAAGVRFAIDNVYNETTNVLVYNMGNSHTQASIHQHSSYMLRDSGVNRTFSQFKVAGKGWSFDIGGGHFDSILIEKFATAFNEAGHLKNSKEGNDVRKIPRAMAKLRKNVQKIKEILSVNDEYPVVFESLANDKDFKMSVKRTDLEAWSAGVLAHVLKPIEDALADAGMTKDDIHAVEIIGGGVRMPAVQSVLAAYFSNLTLGQHLNGDEAMALGGAFVAANRSSAYRVKKIGAIDISPFSVTVNITSQGDEGEVDAPATPETDSESASTSEDGDDAATESTTEETTSASVGKKWFKHSRIFPKQSHLGTTKKIAFRHAHDIEAVLFHDDSASSRLPAGSSIVLARYNITGVEDVVKGPKGHLGTPKLVLSFTLDHNGVYGLTKAEAQLEEMVEVPVPTPKVKPTVKPSKKTSNTTEPAANTTSTEGGSDAEAPTSPVEPTETPVVNATTLDVNATTPDANATEPVKPKTVMKKFVRKFPLKIAADTSSLAVQPMSLKDKAAARRTLQKIQQLDDERRAREAAKNAVEAFIYNSRNKMGDNADDLAKVSSEEDRDALTAALEAAEEWLYDEGESTTLAVYKAKLAELKKVADVIFVPLHQYQNPTPVATPPPVNETDAGSAVNATTVNADDDLAEPTTGEGDATADASGSDSSDATGEATAETEGEL